MIYDFYLVPSSLALLPTWKYYRLRSFSTIIFELPLDPFKVQFLVIINDVFVGPNIFDILTCAKYLSQCICQRNSLDIGLCIGNRVL